MKNKTLIAAILEAGAQGEASAGESSVFVRAAESLCRESGDDPEENVFCTKHDMHLVMKDAKNIFRR